MQVRLDIAITRASTALSWHGKLWGYTTIGYPDVKTDYTTPEYMAN